ncbi:MAG: hypothetical protein ACRCYE_14975 [Sarcina sp.]
MNKKILVSVLIGVILVGGISGTIIYNKETTPICNKSLLNKATSSSSIIKNNETKNNETKNLIKPNTIIVKNTKPQNEMILIGNAAELWISKTQFNYSKFNPKQTELTKAQVEKLKYYQGMLFYSFIDVNGVKATHENITAEELNRTAIVVKQQLTGNWTPPTSGIS